MADREKPAACPRWTPPPWLRRLGAVAAEHRTMLGVSMSPTERLQVVCELSALGLKRLEEQAARRGCSIGALLFIYERAGNRLRARG